MTGVTKWSYSVPVPLTIRLDWSFILWLSPTSSWSTVLHFCRNMRVQLRSTVLNSPCVPIPSPPATPLPRVRCHLSTSRPTGSLPQCVPKSHFEWSVWVLQIPWMPFLERVQGAPGMKVPQQVRPRHGFTQHNLARRRKLGIICPYKCYAKRGIGRGLGHYR